MAFFHPATLRSRSGQPEMVLEKLRDLGMDDRMDLAATLVRSTAVLSNSNAALPALADAENLEGADRLQLASALLRGAGIGADPSPKFAQLSPGGRRLWPLLGGPGLVIQRDRACDRWNTGFDWVPYRSDERVQIFLSTCSGLRDLGRGIGHEIHLVSTSFSPHRTVAGLSAQRYAGLHADNGGYLDAAAGHEQAGFDDWQVVPLDVDLQNCLLLGGPVSLGVDSIAVALPKGMNAIDFEMRVQALLARCRLSIWVDHGEGASHCIEVGIDPQNLIRGTRYEDEVVMAGELVLLDAAGDAHRLARLVENMCIAYWLDLE